ncbi:unnamed protein product, partial [Tetraodon nigroviridis]
LVCDDEWKQPLSPTVYFLGVLMGSFFAGQLADRYGRKPVFFTTMAVQTVFTVVLIFSPSWIVFAIMFFISGMGQMANYVAAFVLGTEILSGKIRILFSTLGVALGYTIGSLLVPLIAYFLRDWKKVFLATSLPALIYILLWWFIPESPRWLVSQGRLEEAEAIIRKAAKMNKVEAPEDIFADLAKKPDYFLELSPHSASFLSPRFTVLTAYYGLTLNSGNLTADPYLSTFISVAVELPAYVCVWLVTQKLPRRPSLICMILLGGLSLFFTQLVPETLPELAIALEMLGKYGFTSGATLLFPYTAEIYPTVIRSTAAGTCSIFPRIGTCIAPFLFQTQTFGKPLPETIEDMSERTRKSVTEVQVHRLRDNEGEQLSRCSRYRLDVVRNLSDQGLLPGKDINVTDLEQEECLDGWNYSKDIYQSTIVSEQFNLVCSEQWKQPFTSTVFLLGVLFGSFFSGQIADRFGRKPVIFATMAFQAVATIIQMFSNSWIMFCILFFITGFGRVSSYVSAFVLGTEILAGEVRIMFSALGVCVELRCWLHAATFVCVFSTGLAISPVWYFFTLCGLPSPLVVGYFKQTFQILFEYIHWSER